MAVVSSASALLSFICVFSNLRTQIPRSIYNFTHCRWCHGHCAEDCRRAAANDGKGAGGGHGGGDSGCKGNGGGGCGCGGGGVERDVCIGGADDDDDDGGIGGGDGDGDWRCSY
jgi:hypothetical protein